MKTLLLSGPKKGEAYSLSYKHWRLKKNYRFSFYLCLVLLLFVELVLRASLTNYKSYLEVNGCNYQSQYRGERKIYLKRPNSTHIEKKEEFKFIHKYNSLGIRNKELSQKEIDSSFIVLALGDSYTEGVGAPTDSTWPAILNEKLIENDNRIICVNGGIAGSDVFFEYYKLKNYLADQLKPKIVLLAVNETDITDVVRRGGLERFNTKKHITSTKYKWWEKIYGNSYIARFVVHEILNYDLSLIRRSQIAALEQRAKASILSLINNEFYKLQSELGFKLIVVLTTDLIELESNQQKLLSDETTSPIRSEIDLISIYQEMHKLDTDYETYFWPVDRHCNSSGYQFWAEIIYQIVQKHIDSHHI